MSQVQVSKIVSLGSTEHVDDSVVCSLVFSTVASLLIKRILISRGILMFLLHSCLPRQLSFSY